MSSAGSAESLRNTMDPTDDGSRMVLKELMFKSGMFSDGDLQQISNTTWRNLEEMLDTTIKMNHFRTKYFNSQCVLFSTVNESSWELLAVMRKLIREGKKKKTKLQIPGNIPDQLNDQLEFLENIINVTSQQMQQVLEEGIRKGINMVEQPSMEPLRDPISLDDNFGELPSIPVPVIPTNSIGTPLNFRPPSSSTPLGTHEVLAPIPLEMILEEEPMPPIPHRISQNALNPDHSDQLAGQEAIPQERLSQYTPRIPPPGVTPRSSDRRAIPFNINEPAAVPEAQEQQLPVNGNDQPDFPALRAEAIRRHIDASPRIPQRRVRARNPLKPLELNVLRAPVLEEMTEIRLKGYLVPTLMLLPPNIYLRADKQVENSASSIPAPLQSHSASSIPAPLQSNRSILQQSSSLHLPSTSREGASVPLPQVPEVQPVSLQEIPEVPEAPHVPMPIETAQNAMDISAIAQIPQDRDNAAVPQVHPNLPIIPEVFIPPEDIPPVPEPQKGRIMRILKILNRKKEMFKEDFREEFSNTLELAGAFRILLDFNGILWTMMSNQANEFISIKRIKRMKTMK